jgi:hypothetical protein
MHRHVCFAGIQYQSRASVTDMPVTPTVTPGGASIRVPPSACICVKIRDFYYHFRTREVSAKSRLTDTIVHLRSRRQIDMLP